MSHFDVAIGDATATLQTIETQLEAVRSEWINTLKTFLPDWFRNEGRSAVTEKPDAATALGRERIAELKREVEELATSAPSIVSKLIDGGPWPHKVNDDNGEPINPAEISYARRGLFQPELGLRKAIWKIYPLLKKFGLGSDTLISAGWEKGEYPYALPDQAATNQIAAQYRDLCEKRYQVNRKLQYLKLEQKKSEVAKQWDDS